MSQIKMLDIISNKELYQYDYDIHTLEYNVLRYETLPKNEKNEYTRLNLKSLLKTQKLTAEFCIKYILNDEYAYTDSEEYITTKEVVIYQKHLTNDDLDKAYEEIYKP
tara:strand:- start:261 stop:584 length:324 start_codon:yes stop_codon:yes gene_type:complete